MELQPLISASLSGQFSSSRPSRWVIMSELWVRTKVRLNGKSLLTFMVLSPYAEVTINDESVKLWFKIHKFGNQNQPSAWGQG